MRYVVAFLRFWYDFVVGDDWRVAAGVVAALGITALLANAGVPAWWLMPVAVVVILVGSMWRATERSPVPPLARQDGRTEDSGGGH
jgi:hypothetical protein